MANIYKLTKNDIVNERKQNFTSCNNIFGCTISLDIYFNDLPLFNRTLLWQNTITNTIKIQEVISVHFQLSKKE